MSPAVVEFMEDLATDVAKQRAFSEAPAQCLAASRLSEQERQAVLSGDAERVRSMMADHTSVQEQPDAHIIIVCTPDEEN
ncbi:hypothetical protein K2224_38200 (plasmid) [Streptomyces sp. BHT-5-2]|uniref:hypothetical protein n=1 Tax=unclassified Streptomyces TaxID=2593676 RepID=UPI001C8E3456|nr:hypothetical protein [Streptomyces sp. BHT-5-2]QZL08855.1 hypothetical protein K2224_38200 [Streptomyces sp. BHT-5-2]